MVPLVIPEASGLVANPLVVPVAAPEAPAMEEEENLDLDKSRGISFPPFASGCSIAVLAKLVMPSCL